MHWSSVLPRHLARLFLISSFAAAASVCAQTNPSVPQPARAASVDTGRSTIRVMFVRNKQRLSGTFKRFTGDIQFDPAAPAGGHASFDVEVGSLELGQKALDEAAQGEEWFDTEHYPNAHFVSTAIVPAGDNKFSVLGRLTLRGKTLNVVLPISYSRLGTVRFFDGVLPVRRLQFGVGQGAWSSTAVVADVVAIRFHIVSPDPQGEPTLHTGSHP